MRGRLGYLAALAVFFISILILGVRYVYAQPSHAYEIYPVPHEIAYTQQSFVLKNFAVTYGSQIDQATKDRLVECAALKDLTAAEGAPTALTTGVYVDTYGTDTGNKLAEEAGFSGDLFAKTDAYGLSVKDNKIIVIGKNTDAAFYGLTTLYHVMAQLESLSIQGFVVSDWADITTRGFIEGYYGNPWSQEDRASLMKWGGYYKLNGYFYAPKDDPKHNKQWRTLYTDEEVERLVKPLADAGNASKCRYIYALHPFMNNKLRFDGNYDADLKILQNRFEQVIRAGVRQIAILADDAPNQGADNYKRLLRDMVAWVHEMQKTYPDLKSELPFCVEEYGGWGRPYFRDFPSEVQIIMTGGRVWGEVSKNFTTSFASTVGRGPFMWINWPCSDNSKNHLIMGGFKDFLHPGVNPSNIEGIVLNPMQQSEPSKLAIFGNAAYSWNIWDTDQEADAAESVAHKYVDHNSALETDSSRALDVLRAHMINQNMDGRVRALQESIKDKAMLSHVRSQLQQGTVDTQTLDELKSFFTEILNAQQTLRDNPGDVRLRDQMLPFLDSWRDTASAGLYYIEALKADAAGDTSALLENFTKAQKALNDARNHTFWYLDHYEKAEVGVQHIVPTMNVLSDTLSRKVRATVDPDLVIKSYISNAFTSPSEGRTDNAIDDDLTSYVLFRSPLYVLKDHYVGMRFNKPQHVENVRFILAGGKNHFYHSKAEYTTDMQTWHPIVDQVFERPMGNGDPIIIRDLDLDDVLAVRLRATENNNVDSWTTVYDISVNFPVDTSSIAVSTVSHSDNITTADAKTNPADMYDGNGSSETWWKSTTGDNLPQDAWIAFDLGSAQQVRQVTLVQGKSASGDVLKNAELQYADSLEGPWHVFGTIGSNVNQSVSGDATARYWRIYNKELVNVWWRVGEVTFRSEDANAASLGKPTLTCTPVGVFIGRHSIINTNNKNNSFDFIVDGKNDTLAWMTSNNNGNIMADQGVAVHFSHTAKIESMNILQDSGDYLDSIKIMVKSPEGTWAHYKTIEAGAGDNVVKFDMPVAATDVRILSPKNTAIWWKLKEVSFEFVDETPNTNAVLSKRDNHGFSVKFKGESARLSDGEIDLTPGELIGMDLGAIRRITNIDHTSTPLDNLELVVSTNGVVWKSVARGEFASPVLGRYVALRNKNTDSLENLSATIRGLQATWTVLRPYGTMLENSIPVNASWGDTRENNAAFDRNMNTTTKFTGPPRAGNTIVFDIGREIDLKSLRLYTSDATADYPRDMVVETSTDQNQWTPAFTIGDGVKDSERDLNMGPAGVGSADSNYPNVRYFGADDLSTRARYIRLRITADYPERALIINEIVVNGGAYISTETNPAFTGTEEKPGHNPSKMLDNNLATWYEGAQPNGYIAYEADKDSSVNSVTIVENKGTTHAKVYFGLVGEAGTLEKVLAGHLDQTLNTFALPADKRVVNVEVHWEDDIPQISNVFFSKAKMPALNIDALTPHLATPEAFDTWTLASQDTWKSAVDKAKAVADASSLTSQASLDRAIAVIERAVSDAQPRLTPESVKSLEDAVASAPATDNDNYIYTDSSFNAYKKALDNIKDALAQEKGTVADSAAAPLLEKLKAAQDGLAFSSRNREAAELLLLEHENLAEGAIPEQYKEQVQKAYNVVKSLVEKDRAAKTAKDKVAPQEFIDAIAAYRNSLVKEIDFPFEAVIVKPEAAENKDIVLETTKPKDGNLLNHTLTMKLIEDEDTKSEISKILDKKFADTHDITSVTSASLELTLKGQPVHRELNDDEQLTITIRNLNLPEETVKDHIHIYHLKEADNVEKPLSDVLNKVAEIEEIKDFKYDILRDTVTFKAKSFSPYVIATMTPKTATAESQTGNTEDKGVGTNDVSSPAVDTKEVQTDPQPGTTPVDTDSKETQTGKPSTGTTGSQTDPETADKGTQAGGVTQTEDKGSQTSATETNDKGTQAGVSTDEKGTQAGVATEDKGTQAGSETTTADKGVQAGSNAASENKGTQTETASDEKGTQTDVENTDKATQTDAPTTNVVGSDSASAAKAKTAPKAVQETSDMALRSVGIVLAGLAAIGVGTLIRKRAHK